MAQVNIHEAKTHLSKLLARVEQGEEIVIARAGHPIARLSRVDPPAEELPPRQFGQMRGKIQIPDDFDAPDPELEALFYDGRIEPEP